MDGCEISGLRYFNCKDKFPYHLETLYAKLGLHRYNMLEETNFQFDSLMKFNMVPNFVSSYYMTLLAHDPDDAAASSLQKTFQVRVDEKKKGTLDITVSVARPKGQVTTKNPFIPHFHGAASADDGIFKGNLPDWPSDDALKDQTRFYLVKESEWQANDWISLYLKLAIVATDRSIIDMREKKAHVLSQLKIVKVAIEKSTGDVEPPNERLKAKSANVYIMFKGFEEPLAYQRVFEIGVDVERKAIVRRVIDDTGVLTLVGKLCGGQPTKKRRRDP